MNFSAEILNRFTLTDYMDDVSNTYVGMDKFVPDAAHPTVGAYLQDPSMVIDGQKLGRAGKQRGDNATKDQYLILNFTLSFQLKTYKCPANEFNSWYDNH